MVDTMAKKYELTARRKLVNRLVAIMARVDKGPAWQLTTTGRKTGERRHTMVTPVTLDDTDYLVAPYGPVSWVLNLRASDRATLVRGRATSRVKAVEVEGEEAGRALARYYHENEKYVAEFFDLAKHATIIDFTRVVEDHPVFRVEHPM
jgi:deazaflavin-dependent oxidoreductase (nitroreductase family)